MLAVDDVVPVARIGCQSSIASTGGTNSSTFAERADRSLENGVSEFMVLTQAPGVEPIPPSAIVADVERHSCVLEVRSGQVERHKIYLLEGCGLGLISGRVMWVRGRKAGMFFEQGLDSAAIGALRRRPSTGTEDEQQGPQVTLNSVM